MSPAAVARAAFARAPFEQRDPRPPLAILPLTLVALAFLALQLSCLTRYGWFRDEFYYLACADHLAAGYVDQPPFSIWILSDWRALFGESLAALRVLPAILGMITVFMTGALARSLGGRRGAQVLAALAAAAAPVVIGSSHYVSMNSFDLLLWLLIFHSWVRVIRTGGTREWIGLGALVGIGLLNKISVLWLVAGLGVGFLLGREREMLKTRGPWIAALIAGALFAPHVAWQMANGWPTLEFMRNATGQKMVATAAVEFWRKQLFAMSPASVLVWVPGLLWLLFARDARRWRTLGITFVVVAGILMAGGHSRASYLAPAYLALFGAGGVALEHTLRGRAGAVRWTIGMLVFGFGAIVAPFAAPILAVDRFIAYAATLGRAPGTEERHAMGPLPQQYADMYGWPELTDVVARAWASLTPEERAHAAIFGQNYGEAGAVLVLGRSRGLTPVLSSHNNFWMWPPDHEIRTVVIIGGDEADNREFFARLDKFGEADHPYAMPYERHLPIWIGRDPVVDLRKAWPKLKHFD